MTGRRRRWLDWKVWLGVVVSVAAMWWTFRSEDPTEIARAMARADWGLLVLSLLPLVVSLIVRAHRWSYFLPDDHSTLRAKYNAINVGFLVTNILPLRLGEFARALIFARKASRSRVQVFTTIVVERFFDVLALAILFVVVLPHVPFESVRGSSDELGVFRWSREELMAVSTAAVVIGIAGFLLLCRFGRSISHALTDVLGIRHPFVRKALTSGFDGLEVLWKTRKLLPALLWSLVLWFVVCVSFWVTLLAFPSGSTTLGAILGLNGAIFMNCVLCAGVAAPAAPGFFGVWHAATKIAFLPYGEADASAILAYAIIVHLLNYALTILLGVESLRNEGVSWSEMRRVEAEDGDAMENATGGGAP